MSSGFVQRPWRLMVCFAVMLGVVTGATPPGFAQEPDVQTEVNPTRATVGDHITLTIVVQHDSTETVGWTESPADLEPFEVLRFSALPSSRSNGHVVSRAQYLLTVFELGDLEVPSIPLSLTSDAAAESRILQTDPGAVSVISVQPDSADIVDIKAPLALPRNWLLLAPWGLLLLVAAGLAYWAHRWYRRRARPEALEPAAPPPPAHVAANEALDRLEAAGLLDRGKVKQYFVEVSEIMRVYIDGRYGIDAMEMTSHDIEAELRRRKVERQALELFAEFHQRCDLVKFAKLRPDLETCRATIPLARELIEVTRQQRVAHERLDPATRAEPAAAVEGV